MVDLDNVFKAYDIRGTVPDQLDAAVCRSVGWAFARFADSPRVLVARDMRVSGEELAAAFTQGVNAAGVSVIDLGLASTDMLYFASGRLDAPGAMFTASHNPSSYNGIKLCLSGARPVGRDSGLDAIRASASQRYLQTSTTGAGSRSSEKVEEVDLIEEYAAHVRSFVDMGSLLPLEVVADTANGMGGLVVPKVFEGLPFRLHLLFGDLDGTFPNHPADPIQPQNLVDLDAAVLERHADVGLAFDGDADRVFLVDEKAQPVSGSLTTALVAEAMLKKHPGATVLYNLICSKVVPETVEANGGIAVRTRVGHSFIKQVMAETGAVFGGEHSGHYYFRDNYRADSGIIAALIVLGVICATGKPLSELLAPYRRYADSGEINSVVDDPVAVVEALAERLCVPGVGCDRTDGLTVDHGDWWFNVRPSNTEPLLRLNVEAGSPSLCQAHVAELLDLVHETTGVSGGVRSVGG